MAWLDSVWQSRAAISASCSLSVDPADFDIEIPPEWDHFWDNIDSSGNELRVTGPDGRTLLTYDVDDGAGGAFDATNRNGRIRLDAVDQPAIDCRICYWLYYNSTSNQGDGSSSVTITSARDGDIELSRPNKDLFAYEPQTPGLARPRRTIVKTSSEVRHIWLRLDRGFARLRQPGFGALAGEEAYYVVPDVLDTGGSTVAGMTNAFSGRFVWHRGHTWVRVLLQNGSDATDYTLSIQVASAERGDVDGEATQLLEHRIGVAVRDTLIT